MAEVVIVEAVRTAVGRRNGSLSSLHANDLLGAVQRAAVDRAGMPPDAIEQVVGGCVGQVGAQSGNVTRNAWLAAGLPLDVPASTVNVQCGSSQQATTLVHGMVGGGLVDLALSCGVETMSRIPMGSALTDPALGMPREGTYADQLRSDQPVPGRRPHRAGNGESAAPGHRGLRQVVAGSGRTGVERAPLRRPDRADRHRRRAVRARRVHARDLARRPCRAANEPDRTRSRAHSRNVVADRRRSGCGDGGIVGAGRRARASRPAPESSTRSSSAATQF